MQVDPTTDEPEASGRAAVDCARFRAAHAEYLDGFMDPATASAMRRHAGECLPCARHDRAIRRGCELAGALPAVRTGDDFRVRLRARLARDRSRRSRLISTGHLIVPGAALIAIVAAIAWSPLLRDAGTDHPVELAPVQARAPSVLRGSGLGGAATVAGPRLYRARSAVAGVWLGDAGVPRRAGTTFLYQTTARDPGYPAVFLEPPDFGARPGLLKAGGFLPVAQR